MSGTGSPTNLVSEKASDLAEFLRRETTGGRLLLLATGLALLWANLDGSSYRSVWEAETHVGPDALHLQLTLGAWASDGLLAIFFFIAGLEVKREMTVGELAGRRAMALPFMAALGGMLVPAGVALAVSGGAAADGGAWAIPVATDIAFALGVLSLAAASLPSGVRVVLLSIAVIDDLFAIALIAVLFTQDLSLAWFAAGLGGCLIYWLTFRLRIDRGWLLVILALVTWVCVHASGVHATVAGILLGLLTPVRPRDGERRARGIALEHRLHPFSAGFAVPVFALAATGIPLSAAGAAPGDAIAVGVFAGLLVGKAVGVFGGARLAVRLRFGTLPAGVTWGDVLPVAILAGIGYTVSLLIAGLALPDVEAQEQAAAAILAASLVASLLALVLLRRRGRPDTRRS